jgi:cryptochrome
MGKARVIYWFRTDLRLHDSPALRAALDLKPEALYLIWCWDPHYIYHARGGSNRFQFLIDCMNDVSSSITKLNKKQKLHVIREGATTVLPKLFKKWKISHLVFEKDTDAYAKERDATVMEEAKKAGVEVIVKSGRTLWDSDEITKAHGGNPTMSMSQIRAAGEKVGDIAEPLDAPKSLPDPGDMKLDVEQTQPTQDKDLNSEIRDGKVTSFGTGIAGPKNDFAVPTLKEVGLPEATTPHRGGESVVLKFLDEILADEEYTATFEKPKTSPAVFEPQSTCLTSPYLHFGALSCRYFYHRVEEIVAKRKKAKQSHSEPPTSLTGQLIFRDMYFAAQAALGWSFSQTYNNSHCRFVPWHLPSKVDVSTKKITGEYEIDSEEAEEWLHRFKNGITGFPWIDAIMRQLKQEGWIHHLARHSVACFLTRGGCYISWERGADIFEEWLIDHEAACNSGNWQWLSCTAFFAQFYRCYSPIAFGKKWDDNGDYVRHYVPELKDIPKKYIYEPHKAPIADQKKANVLIKGDGSQTEQDGYTTYPKPMFDFNARREICIQGMKTAYSIGLYGNDPKILDGTWKQAFDDDAEGPTEGKEGGPGGLETWEDADGAEELESPKKSRSGKGVSESPQAKRGHKREHSQSTLDSTFKKKAK